MPPYRVILALDFGGTKLAAGLWDVETKGFVATGRCLCPTPLSAEASLARMFDLAGELLAQEGCVPAVVGVSFDGPVDALSGRPVTSYHVPGWERVDLSACVQYHWRVPCVIENDANAATLGEGLFGAGRGHQSMLYMTISTGIGGGVLLGGELYRGVQGLAGEIGHMCLEATGPVCSCGRRGCLEALGAGPAIVRMFREEMGDYSLVSLDESPLTAAQIAQAASQGNQVAGAVMRRAAGYVGQAIGSVLNLLNLERVVLGGGVTRSGPIYWDTLRAVASERAMPGVQVDIVPAALDGQAPMWGVCALAVERIDQVLS